MAGAQVQAWIAVCLAAFAGALQPWLDDKPAFYVFLAFIGSSLLMTLWGLYRAQRAWEDLEEAVALEEKWRAQRDRLLAGTVISPGTKPPLICDDVKGDDLL